MFEEPLILAAFSFFKSNEQEGLNPFLDVGASSENLIVYVLICTFEPL